MLPELLSGLCVVSGVTACPLLLVSGVNTAYRDPGGDEVTLVEDEDEVLPGLLLLQVGLDVLGARAYRVTGV